MKIEQLVERREINPKPLPYALDALEPVMSKETMDLHYNIKTKNYFKKYNATGNNRDYNGAYLHTIFFDNLRSPKNKNEPVGNSTLIHIEKHFKTFDKFKDRFSEKAMTLHEWGWCAALADGKIITFEDHELVKNIVLLIDMFEHAYIRDYDSKEKYIDSFWKIVNWDTVDKRLLARYAF